MSKKSKFNVGDTVRACGVKGKILDMNDFGGVNVGMLENGDVVEEVNMRGEISALSPTSLMLFGKDKNEFYIRYLAIVAPPKIQQTQPMSVGSAFDAYVKSYIRESIIGKSPEFEFSTLFTKQVEAHNRDWALVAGRNCFEVYKNSGALADLMLEICSGAAEPRFEFRMEGLVSGVRIQGVPDLHFVNKYGASVFIDWKVNGYCSASGQSPKVGYVYLRKDGVRKTHKKAMVISIKGIDVNVAHELQDINAEWALQLTTYAWLMGETVGSDFICGIEQLACRGQGSDIRVASFRNRIGASYQQSIFERYKSTWDVITSGHYFQELSFEASVVKCSQLEEFAVNLHSKGPDSWLLNLARA